MNVPEQIRLAIESIRADRSNGAHELTRRAAGVLTLTAASAPKCMAAVAGLLSAAQPTMAPVLRLAAEAAGAIDVAVTCRNFLEEMDRAVERVTALAAGLIEGGMTVLTHSASSTVEAAFQRAHESGRRFTICATESRPQLEGIAQAERLGGCGIPVTVITDTGIYRFLPQARLVMVGADTVSPEGLVNKSGTALVALAAQFLHVPIYALCATQKFLPPGVSPAEEPEKDPSEILTRSRANVTAQNYYFDSTPLHLFTGIVTERGIVAPRGLVF